MFGLYRCFTVSLWLAVILSVTMARPRRIKTNCVETFLNQVDDSFRDDNVAAYCSRKSNSAFRLSHALRKLIDKECTELCECVHYQEPDVGTTCNFDNSI